MKKLKVDSLFDNFFTHSTNLMFVADKDGKFVRLNPSWKTILGYEIHELEGKPYINFIHPEDIKETQKATNEIFNKSVAKNFINRYKQKNGKYQQFEWRAFLDDGFIYASARDTSSLQNGKNAQTLTELKQNDATLKSTLESISDALLIVSYDRKILHYNSNFKKLFHFTDDVLESMDDELFLSHAKHQLLNPEEFLIGVGKIYTKQEHEKDIIRFKDGSIIERSFIPLIEESPVKGNVWIFRNITDQKKNEESLLKNQKLLKESQRIAKIGSWVLNLNTLKVIWSNETYNIFGYQNYDTPITLDIFYSHVHNNDLASVQNIINTSLKTKQLDDIICRIITKDNKTRHVFIAGEFIANNHGEIETMLGAVQDITDQKKHEESLLEKQKLLSDSQRIAKMGAWEYLIQTDELFWNDQTFEIFGIKDKSIISDRTFHSKLIHPQDQASVEKQFLKSLKTGIFKPYEYRIILPDKTQKTVKVYGDIEYTEDKKPYRTFGVIQDITEQRRVEQAIREKDIIFRSLVQNLTSASSIYKVITDTKENPVDFEFIDINTAYEQLIGLKKEKLIGKKLLEIFPNTEQIWIDTLKEVYTSGSPITVEHYAQELDMFIELIVYKPQDGLVAMLGTDATEKKSQEKALKESEERARLFVENTPLPIAMFDTNMCYIIASKQWYITYKIKNQDLTGKYHYDIFPETSERWKELHQRAIHGELIKKDKDKFVRLDGSIQWVRYELHPWYRGDKTIGGMVAFTEDITEKVKAADALKESELKIKRFFEVAPVGLGILHNHKFIDLNQQASKITGYALEELLGQSIQKVYPSFDEYNKIDKNIYQGLKEKSIVEIETIWKRKDGKLINVLLAETLLDHKVPSKGNIFTVLDITERKRNERALEKRVLALTRPMGDISTIEFTDLFNIDDLQKLQDAFADATGVASIITYPDGTPITKPSNFCKLCKIVRSTEKGLKKCMESDAKIGKFNLNGPIVQPCFSAGLWDAGASITLGGVHFANWLIGQVRDESIKENEVISYADEIGVSRQEFSNAFNEISTMSKEQFNAVTNALYLLANEISLKSYQNLQQARFISEQKKAEEEIQSMNLELEKRVIERTAQLNNANKDLESFAYSVSHDLRAPIRHIDGFLNMLSRILQPLDPKAQNYLDKISLSSKNMSDMIDALLKFSRLGRANLNLKQVNIEDLVNELIIQLNPDYADRNIQWNINELPEVYGDLALLRIAFENLISNAIKYTGKKKKAIIEIGQVEKCDSEKGYCIYVKDNGAGFDMAYKDKLFGVFQRLHKSEDFEGTGIGLANVKQIILKHNGTIDVEASVDKGATFFITLPKKRTF